MSMQHIKKLSIYPLLFIPEAFLTASVPSLPNSLVLGLINYPHLHNLATSNRVLPLLYHTLRQSNSHQIPEDVLQEWQAECEEIAYYNLLNAREQLRLIRAIEAAGLRAVPYKGAYLAGLAYGDLALRETNDIDLFVFREELDAVVEVLKGQGYRPEVDFTPAAERENARSDNEYVFEGSAPGLDRVHLELHWMPASRRYRMLTELSDIEEFLVPGDIQGQPVLAFSLEMLFLQLCMHHGGIDMWRFFKMVCDLAFLLHRHAEKFDWAVATQQARRLGIYGIMLNGLALVKACFALSFPPEIEKAIARPRYQRLVREQIRNFELDRRPTDWSDLQYFFRCLRYHLTVRERLSDRVMVMLWHIRQIIHPNAREIHASGLAFPWYYVLVLTKPFRLFRDHLARLMRRGG